MIAPAASASVLLETVGPEKTRALAATLARVARAGDRIELLGELGAGKTQFAKGFAAGLGVSEVVNSPSFTLMAEYRGRLPLFHLDLYRLTGLEEVVAGGLLDERQAEGVTLVEWADRLGPERLAEGLQVRLDVLGDERRRVELRASPSHARYLEAATRPRP
jgi:tRNA threonylcarbamoyladenosine biosynthesis protein TsaE